MSEASERYELRLDMLKQARRAAQALDILAPPPPLSISQRRRTGVTPITDSRLWLSIADEDGVLRLREARGPVTRGLARGRARAAEISDEVDARELIPIERLGRDRIRQALIDLDLKLTPGRGLRRVDLANRSIGPTIVAPDPKSKHVLVFVHGTFSQGKSFFESFDRSADEAVDLLAAIDKQYDEVFVFDHPTLTVDPVVNARDLALTLAPSSATVDIVAHSRGGLVARWWSDALHKGSARPGQIVFVGSPLAGTGLAAAPNLRKAIDLLANVSAALAGVGAAVPFLNAAVGLFQVFSSVVRLAATAPIPDVIIGLVPGLRAMSLVSNNTELESLRRSAGRPGKDRFFVCSNFESEKVDWRFWKLFRKPIDRLKDAATDAIFEGRNDLVVDTPSMIDWMGPGARVLKSNVLDFGTSSTVHHTNYFDQRETHDFLAKALIR